MNGYESGSGTGSGTTSGRERPSRPPTPDNEAEFLDRQAEQAKAAMRVSLEQMKAELQNAADVRAWTREHPWVMTASAAVAGFIAASVVIPSKEEQALKRIAELERATAAYPPPEEDGRAERASKRPTRSPRSFWSSLATEALEAVKPALLSALTAGVTAKAAKPTEEEMKAAAAKHEQEQRLRGGSPGFPYPPPPRV